MKSLLAAIILCIVSIFTVNTYAHHMAEGIISDELWQMIDDMLVDADSPHLDLDFAMMDGVIITIVEVDSSLVPDILGIIGTLNNGRLMISSQEVEAGLTRLLIVEPVGTGNSQVIYQ
ncbi:MAG: hypothetical protein ABW080_02860 [Candidatus Thiodiazotropha sp.]